MVTTGAVMGRSLGYSAPRKGKIVISAITELEFRVKELAVGRRQHDELQNTDFDTFRKSISLSKLK